MNLAINGGTPIRENLLQYGKQTIDELDKNAVLKVLEENTYLTTGPKVLEFEDCIKRYCDISYAIAVNSGTAALHCAINSLNLRKTDEIIVTTMSFVATANVILYCNLKPIFCDIDKDTLNIDIDKIEGLVTNNTKAIIVVDFAGQPCNYNKILEIVRKHKLYLIEDAAHSIGGWITLSSHKRQIGSYADITTFSFHPVKNITTCEGGMAVTNNKNLYERMKLFRTHGITRTNFEQINKASYHYEMQELGFNYRIPDLLCALGISQLEKLDVFVKRRQEIAAIYDKKLQIMNEYLVPLKQKLKSVYHIYVVKLKLENLLVDRDKIFEALKSEGIGVNVHYMPIHMQPYYIKSLQTYMGMLPMAERVYNQILTIPLFPELTENDILDVVNALNKVINVYKKI